ncbi:MAG: (2Fe-2S) ferredoxin domain-containing protein [Kiritimatiellae bacterium]|nr:(2Fe-2S) ferredoxin domain-containing protein [Kiritimatiellia bacterium]
MKKLTVETLRALRAEQKERMSRRETAGAGASLVIGMGTCGVAAGAQAARDALVAELKACELNDVNVIPTGCMGLCHSEPTVEVIRPGMPRVIYGRVDAAIARRIVREHLVGGRLVDDHVYDPPAADIVPILSANQPRHS